jgi:molybdenum cofactor cytidylyltransferase
MPDEPAVAGLLLAAGLARRMGSNKLLLPLGGESLLRRAARRALDGGLAPLVVVLGHQAELAGRELAGLPHVAVVHPHYAAGMTTSLLAGLAALPADVPAAAVLLADMPFVTAGMIATLVARYRATAAPLVVSSYEGVDAPPILYDRRLFAELEAAGGGGQQVVRRFRDRAEIVDWPAAALADLDRPDDYARVREAGEGGG